MEIIKKAIFGMMGFILLFMFIAYGLNFLSGFQQQATYLQAANYTTSYGFTFVKYNWDYISYTNNLADTSIWENLYYNLFNEEILNNAWSVMKQYAVKPDNVLEAVINGIMFLANGLKTILNILIMAINLLLVGPLQIINNVLHYLCSLLGINMNNGSWWLATTMHWIRNNFYIPLWTY